MTKKESLGFWKDMQEWYNNTSPGSSDGRGSANQKPHPRGCRGCRDNELSWWCSIYFFFFILYGIITGLLIFTGFLLSLLWNRIRKKEILLEGFTGNTNRRK
jgi:hypothetical protein